jgi:hypothetical protein
VSSDTSALSILMLSCFGFLFLVALTVGIYVFAARRKATDAVTTRPTNLKTLVSPLGYSDAINRLIQVAPTQGYKVEDVAPGGSRVILGTPVTFFSYGFFYPVYFSVAPGGTLVEVGIVSRALQWGPIVSFNHDKTTTMIRNALLPYMPAQLPYQNAPYQYGAGQPPPNPTVPMPPPQYPAYPQPPVQQPPSSPAEPPRANPDASR